MWSPLQKSKVKDEHSTLRSVAASPYGKRKEASWREVLGKLGSGASDGGPDMTFQSALFSALGKGSTPTPATLHARFHPASSSPSRHRESGHGLPGLAGAQPMSID